MSSTKSAARTFVIAEIGVNHNGSIEQARKLIDMAVESGADAVKFQSFSAESLASDDAKLADYQKSQSDVRTQKEMLRSLELTEDEFVTLKEYCDQTSIEFMSTVFDTEWLDRLVDLGVRRIKWPSGELTNHPFLARAASKNLPIILSTGMATFAEVDDAIKVIEDARAVSGMVCCSNSLTVLHCTSLYPAPDETLDLLAIKSLAERYNYPVGYSDHSQGTLAAPLAVMLGASVIEKHITHDRSDVGPDHHASIEQRDFRRMVDCIRRAEKMRGTGAKAPAVEELGVASVARKSLHAVRDIAKDSVVSANDLVAKRPGTGIPPSDISAIVGLKARRFIRAGKILSVRDFQ